VFRPKAAEPEDRYGGTGSELCKRFPAKRGTARVAFGRLHRTKHGVIRPQTLGMAQLLNTVA
jgi:hypothetical protein